MGPLHNKQALLFILLNCVSGNYLVDAGFPQVESYLSTSGKFIFHQWKILFPLVEIYFSLMSAPLRHQTT